MKIARLALIVLAVVVVLSAVPEANACASGFVFSQWDTPATTYNYVYLGTDAATDNASIIGRFWARGARSAHNEGQNDDTRWLFTYVTDPPEKKYIFGNMANGEVGCPPGDMIILVQTPTANGKGAKFTVGVTPATFALAIVWNYTQIDLPQWNAIPIPNPSVAVTNRTQPAPGGTITYNVTFPSLLEGQHPSGSNIITGYRLVRSARPGVPAGIDAGRSAALWTPVQEVTPGSNLTGLTFDCGSLAAGEDLFLAVQPVFDNGQFASDLVGASTQVKCNSTQADPKFRKIDRKPPKE